MISVILYGRNDNYGYNLHKRAALSFNCISEVLSDADEILFVDYNTPDDYPTFPEAILDTLTAKARRLIRIIRVRPLLHERYRAKTHLVALEPIARNIAIRRSRPSSRWILSTNTDMIVVPQRAKSLSDIVETLPKGFYHAPRIEIPELLWESLDRYEPRTVIDTVYEWGKSLHLNEIVLGSDSILYDGPGDFQLIRRTDLFENHGFHESMLLGWHVDSNIAARMKLIYGKVGDIGKEVYGYHCDHTRQVTAAHSHTRVQNDWRRFVEQVERPDIPEQAETWGCPHDEIEEITLERDAAQTYISALKNAIGDPLKEAPIVRYTGDSYNQVNYDCRHVLPFLADLFYPWPRSTSVAWYGVRFDTLHAFKTVRDDLGFKAPVFVETSYAEECQVGRALDICSVDFGFLASNASAFVFDFGFPFGRSGPIFDSQTATRLASKFLEIVELERHRLRESKPARQIIVINAVNNSFEGFVSAHIACGYTPFSTRVRHGTVLPLLDKRQSWLASLTAGEAGIAEGVEIRSRENARGLVAFGPYKFLPEGHYRLDLKILAQVETSAQAPDEECLVVEVRSASRLLAVRVISRRALLNGIHELLFNVPKAVAKSLGCLIETRIIAIAPVALTIEELAVEPTSLSEAKVATIIPGNWLPLLQVGAAGRMEDGEVRTEKGRLGHVVGGPYWPLAPGRYQMTAAVEPLEVGLVHEEPLGVADVAADARSLASKSFDAEQNEVQVLFEVPSYPADGVPPLIETRIFSSGAAAFRVSSISVKPWEGDNWVTALGAGEAGIAVGTTIRSREHERGCVAYGAYPFKRLKAGWYQLKLYLRARRDESERPGHETCALIVVKAGVRVLAVQLISRADLSDNVHELMFELPATIADSTDCPVETRIVAVSPCAFTIDEITIGSASITTEPPSSFLRLSNWLPVLATGIAATLKDGVAEIEKGSVGVALWGPYFPLSPGCYQMIAALEALEPPNSMTSPTLLGAADVAVDARSLAYKTFDSSQQEVQVSFEVPLSAADGLAPLIETRIFSSGAAAFRVRSISVTPEIAETKRETQILPISAYLRRAFKRVAPKGRVD